MDDFRQIYLGNITQIHYFISGQTLISYSKKIMIQYRHEVWRGKTIGVHKLSFRHTACPYANWIVYILE